MKILFISPYPRSGGSSRFRIYQYLPYLAANGHQVAVCTFLSETGYRVLYQPGRLLRKVFLMLAGMLRCLAWLPRLRRCDVCVVHREVALWGPGWVEWLVARLSRRLVYDFDDAVFEPHVSSANRWFAFLKSTRKIPRLIARAHAVIAGNGYLATYARQYCARIFQLPTPVEVNLLVPQPRPAAAPLVIGWIGSHSTAPYLKLAEAALQGLLAEMGARLRIEIIGAGDFRFDGLAAHYRPWVLEREVEDLQRFDIGIMPMPDNRWTRGKCGFKALQYMSVAIPVVCSPVGMNRELVTPGENGFWAENTAEWQHALRTLITDAELRRQMGQRGRRLVEERYSTAHCAQRLDAILQAVAHA